MIGLQRALARPAANGTRRPADAVLAGVAAHYQGNPLEAATGGHCCEAIDTATHAATFEYRARISEALMMLSGLRSVLFPQAPLAGFRYGRGRMIGEVDLYGVLLPPLLVWLGVAYARSPRRLRAGSGAG